MSILTAFADVTDFRVQGRVTHLLGDILALLLCGTLAGCDDLLEICDYGHARLDFLRQELGLPLAGGIPSEDTLARVLQHLCPKQLEHSLRACAHHLAAAQAAGLPPLAGQQVCLDGKAHRATLPAGKHHALVRTVSVWLAEEQLSFGQRQVGAKTTEKTAMVALLEELDVRGSIVTVDAIASQPAFAQRVLAQGADYVIALKKNQKTLYEQLHDGLLAQAPTLPSWVGRALGHGRGEVRTVRICQQLGAWEAAAAWPGLRTVVWVETQRHTAQGVTQSRRLYLSSLSDPDPATYARLVRGHWSIENQLHWQLDVTFGEDQSRLRTGHAALNANILRKMALYLLNQVPGTMSRKRKRKLAAYDNRFLLTALQAA